MSEHSKGRLNHLSPSFSLCFPTRPQLRRAARSRRSRATTLRENGSEVAATATQQPAACCCFFSSPSLLHSHHFVLPNTRVHTFGIELVALGLQPAQSGRLVSRRELKLLDLALVVGLQAVPEGWGLAGERRRCWCCCGDLGGHVAAVFLALCFVFKRVRDVAREKTKQALLLSGRGDARVRERRKESASSFALFARSMVRLSKMKGEGIFSCFIIYFARKSRSFSLFLSFSLFHSPGTARVYRAPCWTKRGKRGSVDTERVGSRKDRETTYKKTFNRLVHAVAPNKEARRAGSPREQVSRAI